MTRLKIVYISLVVIMTVCIAILSHLFFPHPFISDIKIYPGKALYTADFTDPTIKTSHFIIKVEENDLTLYINGEEQFKYTPKTIIENYSISFFYPGNTDIISGKTELTDIQFDTWTAKK